MFRSTAGSLWWVMPTLAAKSSSGPWVMRCLSEVSLAAASMVWAAVWISDSGLMGFLMLPVLTVGNCSGRRWGIDN